MKDFNKSIDSIIDWLTEPDGGNAITESDIREAIAELNELRKFNLLYLPDVSNRRELLIAYTLKLHSDAGIDRQQAEESVDFFLGNL